VGLGLVPESPLGREFRDNLGRLNAQVASAVTDVYFLTAGIPMKIKETR
jgi:adenosylcobinamide kinase/adenosylcobinamide-phosphate guanylyltransferase